MKFYKKVTLLIFALTVGTSTLLKATANYNIAFIHIGEQLPPYVARAIKQARLFNKKCPIFLVSSKTALENTQKHQIDPKDITFINYETLPQTEEHLNFSEKTRFKNFWKVTSERYLVLYDFIKAFNLHNVFHFENDVMIYINLEKLLPIFEKNYQLALPFDHDNRAISSFVYIKDHCALQPLATCFTNNAINGYNDMQVPPILAQQNKNCIQKLPILMPDYCLKYSLENVKKEQPKNPSEYTKNFELFNYIFDAAALGQYLGGIYLQHKSISSYGFINETNIFNPSHFSYIWKKDNEGRFVPYIILNDEQFPIANLHIHSKKLKKFASDNPSIVTNEYIKIAPKA